MAFYGIFKLPILKKDTNRLKELFLCMSLPYFPVVYHMPCSILSIKFYPLLNPASPEKRLSAGSWFLPWG